MGRTEPTIVKPPAAFRRDMRAKRARATLNKVIPAMLSAHPRAARGIERSELVVDPAALSVPGNKEAVTSASEGGGSAGAVDSKAARRAGRRDKKAKRKDGHSNGDERKRPSHEEEEEEEAGEENSAANRHRNLPGDGDTNCAPRITLYVGDALAAAHGLLSRRPPSPSSPQKQEKTHQRNDSHSSETGVPKPRSKPKKIGVLNMASPLAAGGGFLNGATGPEAALCLRTTLLPALRDEFYRLPEPGVVYTPDVLVFRLTTGSSWSHPSTSKAASASPAENSTGSGRIAEDPGSRDDDILPKNDRFFIDVASAAMLRLPETSTSPDGRAGYALASDRELAMRKMRGVLRAFAARGCTAVVLGAWGCGVHEGNPVEEIAGAWRRVLGVGGDESRKSEDGEVDGRGGNEKKEGSRTNGKKTKREKEKEKDPWGAYITDVIFAVPDQGTARVFARVFGAGIASLSSRINNDDEGKQLHEEGEEGARRDENQDGDENEDEEEEEDPVRAARERELRAKIAELETQLAQVRSPHLRAGIESVLAGLRRQLAASLRDSGGGNEEDEDEEEAEGGTDDDGDDGDGDRDMENEDENEYEYGYENED